MNHLLSAPFQTLQQLHSEETTLSSPGFRRDTKDVGQTRPSVSDKTVVVVVFKHLVRPGVSHIFQ